VLIVDGLLVVWISVSCPVVFVADGSLAICGSYLLLARWLVIATLVLSMLALDGCFAAQVVVVRWMLITVLG
jgi:hypothetical protein